MIEFTVLDSYCRYGYTGFIFKKNKQICAIKNKVCKHYFFPIPYYANNPQETKDSGRFVTFTHLPERASIRIYDLAGYPLAKLQKDDATQFVRWNLQNDYNQQVASGLYIAHIDMP